MKLFSLPLPTLSAVAFVVGTAEFVAIGLVPQVARDLDVSVGAAGTTVSLYALAVGLTALPLARMLSWRPPRAVLSGLMLLFAAANVVNAFAPSPPVLLGGRVFSAAAQGVALGVATAVAGQVVAPEQRGKAVSLVFGGLMSAMFLGAPLGTLLGGLAGWRAAFAVLAVVGLALSVTLWRVVPGDVQGDRAGGTLVRLRVPQVLVPMGIATAVLLATSVLFPYLGAYLEVVGGVGPAGVSLGLAAFGVSGLAGNVLGGFVAGRRDVVVLAVLATALAVAVAAFALSDPYLPLMLGTIVVWGVLQMALLPVVTTAVVEHGGSFGATANVAAVNLGIAAGGLVGGPVADRDLGLLPWIASAGVAVLAVVLVVRAVRVGRARTRPEEPVAAPR